MKKKIVAGVVLTILVVSNVACDIPVVPGKVNDSISLNIAKSLNYIKDSRSNLCYAVLAVYQNNERVQIGMSITNVPCTPEVETLILLGQ